MYTEKDVSISKADNNSKIHCPSFSLTPGAESNGGTCADGVPCDMPLESRILGLCYAEHMAAYHKTVMDAWARNTAIIKGQDGYRIVYRAVVGYIMRYGCAYFRWNVAGDVFSVEYGKLIIAVARACPDCHFALMTKRYDNVHAAVMECGMPDNLNVSMSVWDWYKPSAEIMARTDLYTFNYFQDKKGCIITPADLMDCPGECGPCRVCYKGTVNVRFNQH